MECGGCGERLSGQEWLNCLDVFIPRRWRRELLDGQRVGCPECDGVMGWVDPDNDNDDGGGGGDGGFESDGVDGWGFQ